MSCTLLKNGLKFKNFADASLIGGFVLSTAFDTLRELQE